MVPIMYTYFHMKSKFPQGYVQLIWNLLLWLCNQNHDLSLPKCTKAMVKFSAVSNPCALCSQSFTSSCSQPNWWLFLCFGNATLLGLKNKCKKRLPGNVTQAAIMFPPKHIQQTKLVIYFVAHRVVQHTVYPGISSDSTTLRWFN